MAALLAASRQASADQDPSASCADVLNKIGSLSTAAASKDLANVLALATGLADTPTIVRCKMAEQKILRAKQSKIDQVLLLLKAQVTADEKVLDAILLKEI